MAVNCATWLKGFSQENFKNPFYWNGSKFKSEYAQNCLEKAFFRSIKAKNISNINFQ